MNTNNITVTKDIPTEAHQQEKSNLNKTAVAITGIIAGCSLVAFFKFVDVKYGCGTELFITDKNIKVYFNSHAAKNTLKQCQA